MSNPGENMYLTGARKKQSLLKGLKKYEGQYATAGEYAAALRSWMNQMYQMQCISATFPYFLASMQAQVAAHSTLSSTATTTTTSTTTSSTPGNQQRQANQQSATATPTTPANQAANNNQAREPSRGVEYGIPPLWKRVIAEGVDFLLLFAVKLAVTFAAVDAFDLLSDVEKYDFENLRADIMSDYKMAIQMTSEILILELIHRIGICVFEALCLHRGAGGTGGATPGKKLVGLRVVRCEWVAPTGNEQAVIYPACDLGLSRAVLRSVVKNFSLTFLFPICFILFSFQHNRTVYDIISGSIVIEDRRNARQRNAAAGAARAPAAARQ